MAFTKVTANVDGTETVELNIAYELIGDSGRPWIITPGGRFSKDYPGVRHFASALAELGNRVVIWDRPNCGESEVCFVGSNESAMQADVEAALLVQLGVAPAVIIGGSGGARVSLLTASRHPEVARGLAVWWISGGVYGLMSLGTTYCSASITSVWNGGMQAVVDVPETTLGNWQEVMERNPVNRQRLLDQDPKEFLATMERWMFAYCPCGGATVPGLPDEDARRMTLPALVFRSGASDANHTRKTSEDVAALLPTARLLEPPWGDREWVDSKIGYRFVNWYKLAPILNDWAKEKLA
jgi:pimeloyl-ACP methyl ester carboxylesterase